MKKKVLFLITKSNWGGAQRYVYDLATSLPKDQYDVVVAFGQHGELADRLEEAGIPTHELESLKRDISFGADFKSYFELIGIFKREKPDIVHLNSSKGGILGALAAHAAHVPNVIFTAHGWPFGEDRSFPVRALYWFASYMTALLSDKVIVVSKLDLKRVQTTMPFVSQKTFYIANGTPPAPSSSGTRVGTVAEHTHNKGLDILLQAAALSHEPYELALVGDGEDRHSLEELAKKLRLEKRVHFIGHDYATAQEMAFELFVMPSRKEGLPFALLEAGAHGLAVVATNVGGIPDVIEDNVTGLLVPPNDPQALANAIDRLHADPELRARLGAALKEKVSREFSLQKIINRTFDLYRS